ncbi:MAG TPA: DUF2231 domain-containing protein [Methylophilaceae bacterium]|jgi:uncharacterized membrane protein
MPERHPLHPALVHFPIVCWTLATVGDVISPWWGIRAWWTSGMLLVLGIVMALPAMISGLVEFSQIDEQSAALPVAERHMQLICITWTIYAASLFMRMDGRHLAQPGLVAIGLSLLGLGFLLSACWFGGRLVYRYRVGVTEEDEVLR